MKSHKPYTRSTAVLGLVAMTAMALGVVLSAAEKAPAPVLTAKGKQLEAQYTKQLEALQAEIVKTAPAVPAEKKAAYTAARKAEAGARNQVKGLEIALGKNRDRGLLRHRQNWLAKTDRAIADARKEIKAAEAMTDAQAKAKALAAAEKKLKSAIDHRPIPVRELKKCEEAAAKAKKEEPALVRKLEAAKKNLVEKEAATLKLVGHLGLTAFLESNELDGRLATFFVLSHATPKGLALYAQHGAEQEKRIEALFVDTALMVQMAVANGANAGKYGRTMEIYSAIQRASKKAGEGVLQRLALAVSLQHAVPHRQSNPVAEKDAPTTVDPVKRYLHFEGAYLAGELDPGFKGMTVWDYRMVVDGDGPDQALAWGRKMLRNYRPDHISTPDYRWRYVKTVATDIRYGSQDNKYDKPELQANQNILMNGGVCGRRAFFGRFILRAFGIPTVPRPQRGHAALAHWTPDGWVVCLGGGWGVGWVGGRRKSDLIFLAETQGRQAGKGYLPVKRASWIGEADAKEKGFWGGLSADLQRKAIEEARAVALAAVGTDIGEANESKKKEAVEEVTVTDADRKIVIGGDGAITIPAVACSKPTNSTGKIRFMKSSLGGMQLHYERRGKAEDFEYTFDAPKAGTYALTARIVTPSWKQSLQVVANGAKEPVTITLPFTIGMWETTKPVKIDLVAGKNVLTFSRDHQGLKGLSIRDFTLAPVK